MKKTVSIITRTKNRDITLRRAIQSVLNQSYADWRHIIVNDGGNQAIVAETVREFQELYKQKGGEGSVVIVHNEQSQGLGGALNAGLELVDSKYICVHDDDDTWQSDFLEQVVSYLEKSDEHEVGAVATWANLITEKFIEGENPTIERLSSQIFDDSLYFVSLFDIASQNRIPPISLVYRSKIHEEFGKFEAKTPAGEDWMLYIKILTKYEIKVIPKALANYHMRPESTGDIGNSIIDGTNKHASSSFELRNRYLRQDLNKSKFGKDDDHIHGLGFLMNLSGKLKEIENRMKYLENIEQTKSRSLIRRLLNKLGV
jgi:glycosyltransferase involved in cell wall biosynthesis